VWFKIYIDGLLETFRYDFRHLTFHDQLIHVFKREFRQIAKFINIFFQLQRVPFQPMIGKPLFQRIPSRGRHATSSKQRVCREQPLVERKSGFKQFGNEKACPQVKAGQIKPGTCRRKSGRQPWMGIFPCCVLLGTNTCLIKITVEIQIQVPNELKWRENERERGGGERRETESGNGWRAV
jgi:hypothetical protein